MAAMTPAAQLAIGRILRLASRPTRPGDVEQYEAARSVFLSEMDRAGVERSRPERPDGTRHGWNRGVVE